MLLDTGLLMISNIVYTFNIHVIIMELCAFSEISNISFAKNQQYPCNGCACFVVHKLLFGANLATHTPKVDLYN